MCSNIEKVNPTLKVRRLYEVKSWARQKKKRTDEKAMKPPSYAQTDKKHCGDDMHYAVIDINKGFDHFPKDHLERVNNKLWITHWMVVIQLALSSGIKNDKMSFEIAAQANIAGP